MSLREHQMVTISGRVVKFNDSARSAQVLLTDGAWLSVSYDNIDGLDEEDLIDPAGPVPVEDSDAAEPDVEEPTLDEPAVLAEEEAPPPADPDAEPSI